MWNIPAPALLSESSGPSGKREGAAKSRRSAKNLKPPNTTIPPHPHRARRTSTKFTRGDEEKERKGKKKVGAHAHGTSQQRKQTPRPPSGTPRDATAPPARQRPPAWPGPGSLSSRDVSVTSPAAAKFPAQRGGGRRKATTEASCVAGPGGSARHGSASQEAARVRTVRSRRVADKRNSRPDSSG